MKNLNFRIVHVSITFLTLSLVSLSISGCASILIVKSLSPVPGYTEVIMIPSNISNSELTKRLLIILAKNKIAPCNHKSTLLAKDQPQKRKLEKYSEPSRCLFNNWHNRKITFQNRSSAIITIGDYPNYNKNTVGHSARIKRISANKLKITVKGQGIYFMKLPNEAVARQISQIIKSELLLSR